jgi:predicted component of type VI protein secretion system
MKCNTNDKNFQRVKTNYRVIKSEISKKITLSQNLRIELLCITITKLLQTLD